ncbi:MAG: hypothetical protein WCK63_12250 [Betaproteobacteria bacterium]
MEAQDKAHLRTYLMELLTDSGYHGELADEASIFVSGKLDSLNMMMLVMKLEESFGIDFGRIDFDVSLIDSLIDIESLVDSQKKQSPH